MGLAKSFLFLVAMAPAAGCGVTVESTWKDKGAPMASFDLQCPAEKIEVTVLRRNDGLGCSGSQVGARGCGQQTQYECMGRTWHRSAEVSSTTK